MCASKALALRAAQSGRGRSYVALLGTCFVAAGLDLALRAAVAVLRAAGGAPAAAFGRGLAKAAPRGRSGGRGTSSVPLLADVERAEAQLGCECDEEAVAAKTLGTPATFSSRSMLLYFVRPELPIMVAGAAAMLAAAAASLALPAYMGRVVAFIDDPTMLPHLRRTQLRASVIELVGVGFGLGAFSGLVNCLFEIVGMRSVCRVRRMTFSRLVQQDVVYYDATSSGVLLSRVLSDSDALESLVSKEIVDVVRQMVRLAGSLVLMFSLSWKLALVILSVVPPVLFITIASVRAVRARQKVFTDRLAETAGLAAETLGNIRTVRMFGNEKPSNVRFGEGIESCLAMSVSIARINGASSFSNITLSMTALAAMVWVGGTEVLDGTLSVSTLTTFLLYMIQMASSVAMLFRSLNSGSKHLGALERVYKILRLDVGETVATPAGAAAAALEGGLRGEIELRKVAFNYAARPLVLNDVSLRIAAGSKSALVGPSGGGKSTIVSLLLRLYDARAGEVLVDGVNVRLLDPTWLRGHFACVGQEPVLFARSIRDNITYGRPDASVAEVERAADLANVLEFTKGFDDGLDTLVGERGVKLSGGQKQRVAIARALVCEPRVLLLDEATSALDSESEALVQEALERAMGGRTCVVVAHRLSTVKDADRVYVIEGGAVAQQGTHDELLQDEQGTYRRLVQRQMIGSRSNLAELAQTKE